MYPNKNFIEYKNQFKPVCLFPYMEVVLVYKQDQNRKFISFREMFKIKRVSCNFPPIRRVFISESSSAGKKYFAKILLETKLSYFKRIYYFYPDIHEQCPTNWSEELSTPVFYQAGLLELAVSLKDHRVQYNYRLVSPKDHQWSEDRPDRKLELRVKIVNSLEIK